MSRHRDYLTELIIDVLDGYPATARQLAEVTHLQPTEVRSILISMLAVGQIEMIARRFEDGYSELLWSLSDHGKFHHEFTVNTCKHCKRFPAAAQSFRHDYGSSSTCRQPEKIPFSPPGSLF